MKRDTAGFTLMELLVTVGILALVLTSMMQLLIYASTLSEMGGSKTLAVKEAQDKMEEIRRHAFGSIAADYSSGGTPGNTFTLSTLTGEGLIEIEGGASSLLTIDVSVCWEDKYDRVLGEDRNLNGTLDPGEDADGDDKIDCPIHFRTMVAER